MDKLSSRLLVIFSHISLKKGCSPGIFLVLNSVDYLTWMQVKLLIL